MGLIHPGENQPLGVIVTRLKLKNGQTGTEWHMGTQIVNELKPNKHHIRAKQTRELLLNSAETVFVRDGYLGAELGEIAGLAGRSKGAIYGHFKSKEDLYFALLEERISRYRGRVEDVLLGCTSKEEISRALTDHFFSAIKEDKAWCRLLLEFKLFATRNHPAKRRLQKIHKNLYFKEHLKDLPEIWASLGQRKLDSRTDLKAQAALGAQVALASMAAIVPALVLEEEFAPAVLNEAKLKDVVTQLVEALLMS